MLELAETPAEGVAREVLEEACIKVQADRLTGVYKNRGLGVVTLAFRCRIIDGQGEEDTTDEAKRIAWLTVGAVALDCPAGDRGDLAEAERDRDRGGAGPAMHSDMLPRATAATYRRRIENRIRAGNTRLP